MRIALLTDGIWPFVIGGMQKHSYFLCKYLLREGATVHLFHTSLHKQIPDPEAVFTPQELNNLVTHYIPFPETSYFPGHYFVHSYQYSRSIFKVFQEVSKEPFDFVYIQGLSGWELLNQTDKDVSTTVLNFHGLEMFQQSTGFRSKLESWVFRFVVKKLLNRASVVQSLGGQLTAVIRQNITSSNTTILELGIGIEDDWIRQEITPTGTQRVVTFIGRYERRKGVEELYKAIKEYQNQQNFELHFIGPIPGHLQLAASNFHYHGMLQETSKIQNILDQSDFLIVPSYSEGMPTVILEAMARGCAIIATDVGAVSEQVGASNGILMEKPTINGIRSALESVMQTSRTEIDEMKKKSLQKVSEQFRWSVIIRKLIDELYLS